MKRLFNILMIAGLTVISGGVQGQQDYQKWLKGQQSEFQNFQDKRDKQFMDFLKKDWEDFQVSQGIVRDPEPKPVTAPEAKPRAEKEPIPPDQPIVKPKPVPAPPKPQEIESTPSPVKIKNAQKANFGFFGNSASLEYDNGMQYVVNTPVNADEISKFWGTTAQADYKPVQTQLEQMRKHYDLNDWGFAQLLYNAGLSIENTDKNAAQLFTWFFLLKTGYKVKVGFNADHVYLMIPSTDDVYDVPYLTVDDSKYYVIPLDNGAEKPATVTTYEGDYPEATQDVDFHITALPNFPEKAVDKTVKFSYLGKDYTLKYHINQNAVDFLNSYPQTDLAIYPEAGLTNDAAKDLLTQLQQIVDGEPETRAVNILLRFVQTGFKYETDDEQFGHENYLFPEESLYYPASDCEDRSALFAYLVKNLLGLDVVLLDYPGHVATAVKFTSDVKGDNVEFDGAKYTVCDPTYIYAEYGMTMPSVKNQKYKVIQLPKG